MTSISIFKDKKKKYTSFIFWLLLSMTGAAAMGAIAFHRGESINALWFVTAAVCVFAVSYRFHSKWLVTKVLMIDDNRATPALVREDGRDYVPTNKWIVLGHHFAAIAGPGPLVGPVLAAQFGYLPGTLWILIGAVIGGAVQDTVILFCSMRHGGRSLGQIVKEEVGLVAGVISLISILCIMVILVAVLSLVVVKALALSSWGLFTISMTIPIAMFMGIYLRLIRPGHVGEASAFGVTLLLLAVWGGQFIHSSPVWSSRFTWSATKLAWAIMSYGLSASILPVWLLLAPRDYLSSFMKIGTVMLLVLAIIWLAPTIQMPKLTSFIDGGGLVIPGKVFPFVFITIACGAISGGHALYASGVTPKLIPRESNVRLVGYGAMIIEMVVGVIAIVAACAMQPGEYFAINIKGEPAAVIQQVTEAGFPITEKTMTDLAHNVGEETMYGRTGGAPTFAVGIAQMFSKILGTPAVMSLWYHFAIMFEVLFILTTVDALTRAGRYLLQDILGHIWKPLGDTRSYPANVLSSTAFVTAWGWSLYRGVIDPLGGINTLWPIFGIANQLLAVIAFALGTTVLMKMGKVRYAWVTLAPMMLLLTVTFTAVWQKVFSTNAAGFLPAITQLEEQLTTASAGDAVELHQKIFNNQVDIFVVVTFAVLTLLIVAVCVIKWWRLLTNRLSESLHEDPMVMLDDHILSAKI